MAPKRTSTFAAAVRLAGSVRALARSLGLAESSVRRWKTKLPESRRDELAAWVDRTREARVETTRPKRASKRDLERELRSVKGNATALAKKLGVAPSTVRKWLKDGLTEWGREKILALRQYSVAVKAEEAAGKREKERFQALLDAAEKKTPLPIMPTTEGAREGYTTKGYRWTQSWERELSISLVEDVRHWAERLTRRKQSGEQWWQFFATLVQFDPTGQQSKPYGYMRGIIQVNPKVMAEYVLVNEVVTPRSKNFSKSLESFEEKLLDVLDAGFRALLIGTTLFNYHLRTPEEKKQWRTETRRVRGRKKERKPRRL